MPYRVGKPELRAFIFLDFCIILCILFTLLSVMLRSLIISLPTVSPQIMSGLARAHKNSQLCLHESSHVPVKREKLSMKVHWIYYRVKETFIKTWTSSKFTKIQWKQLQLIYIYGYHPDSYNLCLCADGFLFYQQEGTRILYLGTLLGTDTPNLFKYPAKKMLR